MHKHMRDLVHPHEALHYTDDRGGAPLRAYMRACVRACVQLFVCAHVYVRVCVRLFVCAHVCVCACVNVCERARVQAFVCARIYEYKLRVCMVSAVHVFACMYVHMHT